jgi:hypothetical protein
VLPPISWPLAAAALVALVLVGLAFRGLSHCWPEHLPWNVAPLVVPAAAVLWTVWLLPGSDGAAAQASALSALRADPFVLVDIAPLSSAGGFRLLAWPLAVVFGDALGVRVLAAAALGIALLLTHSLARGLGAPPWAGCLAQLAALALPEMRAPLVAGRFPGAVGTAGELAVLVHLVRRQPVLEAARDGAAACAFFFAAMALYAGAIPVLLALVLAAAALETAAGHRRRGRWLLGAYGIALGLAVLVVYGWSIPAFVRAPALLFDPRSPAPGAMPWRPEMALLAALAASLLLTRAASGAALRTHAAAVLAALAVAAIAAASPVRLGLESHALAFGAASLASLAACGVAGLVGRMAGREPRGTGNGDGQTTSG